MKREAIFDESGTYRYSLYRQWNEANDRKVTFVLLHPGTADEYKDDVTSNKCMKLANRWGFGSLEIVNLFAYQAGQCTMLEELEREDAVGYDNDRYIKYAIADAQLVIAGWGENSKIHNRDHDLPRLFSGTSLYCMGTYFNSHPRHPLLVPQDVPLERYALQSVRKYHYANIKQIPSFTYDHKEHRLTARIERGKDILKRAVEVSTEEFEYEPIVGNEREENYKQLSPDSEQEEFEYEPIVGNEREEAPYERVVEAGRTELEYEPIMSPHNEELEYEPIVGANEEEFKHEPVAGLNHDQEDVDSWLFCSMCYDEYPMHGQSVCHTCYEQSQKNREIVKL